MDSGNQLFRLQIRGQSLETSNASTFSLLLFFFSLDCRSPREIPDIIGNVSQSDPSPTLLFPVMSECKQGLGRSLALHLTRHTCLLYSQPCIKRHLVCLLPMLRLSDKVRSVYSTMTGPRQALSCFRAIHFSYNLTQLWHYI